MNTQKVKVSILTIFIFSFISCGKSEQEKCEEKEAPWKWNAEQKRCVNPNSPDGDKREKLLQLTLKKIDETVGYFVLLRPDTDYPDLFLISKGRVPYQLSSTKPYPCIRVPKSDIHLYEVYYYKEDQHTTPLYLCSNVKKDQPKLKECHLGTYQAVLESESQKKVTSPIKPKDCLALGL